jgi:hypothetical protein
MRAQAQSHDHAERLWTADDGTMCLLVTSEKAPMYTITLVRNHKVLQERRLYGRSSAQMIAQSWSDSNSELRMQNSESPQGAK